MIHLKRLIAGACLVAILFLVALLGLLLLEWIGQNGAILKPIGGALIIACVLYFSGMFVYPHGAQK